jgi:hypothetical protein
MLEEEKRRAENEMNLMRQKTLEEKRQAEKVKQEIERELEQKRQEAQ